MNSGLKRCGHCKKEKRPDEFYANRTTPDGYQIYCIVCKKRYDRNRVYTLQWLPPDDPFYYDDTLRPDLVLSDMLEDGVDTGGEV